MTTVKTDINFNYNNLTREYATPYVANLASTSTPGVVKEGAQLWAVVARGVEGGLGACGTGSPSRALVRYPAQP